MERTSAFGYDGLMSSLRRWLCPPHRPNTGVMLCVLLACAPLGCSEDDPVEPPGPGGSGGTGVGGGGAMAGTGGTGGSGATGGGGSGGADCGPGHHRTEDGDCVLNRFPGDDWDECTPESEGVDSAAMLSALETLESYCGDDGVTETVIIRNGCLIHRGSNSTHTHGVWSTSKTFTSTALGLLVDDDTVTVDTMAADYEPLLESLYDTVTLGHFAIMSSGYDSVNVPAGENRWGQASEDWSVDPYDPTTPWFAPGAEFLYWDEAMMMNGRVLTRILGTTLQSFVQQRITDPIGMGSWSWNLEGSVDGTDINNGCTGVNIHAEQLARFGYLYLNRGNWNGTQLLGESWVEQATVNQAPNGIYGYNIWVNGIETGEGRLMPDAPEGLFYTSGYNNNMCFVVPEWDLVFVRMGLDGNPPEGKPFVYNIFFSELGDAILDG